jgi:hypothetical protein
LRWKFLRKQENVVEKFLDMRPASANAPARRVASADGWW